MDRPRVPLQHIIYTSSYYKYSAESAIILFRVLMPSLGMDTVDVDLSELTESTNSDAVSVISGTDALTDCSEDHDLEDLYESFEFDYDAQTAEVRSQGSDYGRGAGVLAILYS